LAKAKKAEKDLANANKEHLQREQAVAEPDVCCWRYML
jgi:hypothetical protein